MGELELATTNKQGPTLHLDLNSQKNFVAFYKNLGEKPPTTIRFFDRTDLYTVHGADDTELIAKMIYKTTAYIKKLLPESAGALPYITLAKVNFEAAIRELLLVRNYRVEVYVRQQNDGWNLEYRGSPGNLLQFEDILFSNKELLIGNNILSIQIEAGSGTQRKIGVASVEQNDCQFKVLEFADDDFLTELEATMVLLAPKECLLPKNDGEYASIKTLLERHGVMITVPKKPTSAEKLELLQDLNRLLHFAKGQHEDAAGLPEMNLKLAMEALRCAIKYLDLVNDAGNEGRYEIQQFNLDRFVHLDAAAVSALNILPPPESQIGRNAPAFHYHSILGVLDHCRTPQGHRLMAHWVKQPLRDKQILNDRHNIVQCLLDSPLSLSTLHEDHLKRIPDILMLTKKLMRNKATLQDVFRIFQVMLRVPKAINLLLELENTTVKSVLCEPIRNLLEDLKGLKNMVEQVMDFDALESRDYLIKASFDEELQNLKSNMTRLLSKMENLQEKTEQDLDLPGNQVRLENISKLGYHFRINLKSQTTLRKNKNYEVLDVVKSGVRFTNKKLKEYSEEYAKTCEDYEQQQQSIVDEIIKVAIGYAAPLTSLNNEIAQLDCLVSFAIAAQAAPTQYVRPTMIEEGSGFLILKDLRHPCLELQENITYMANDVEFQDGTCNMLIITGPNMGGKSTFIRSVGTAVLMAHVGAFVPASEATISMVDSILGRVGASDNIIKGLSTFMVEMIETSAIVRSATAKSLVIIDELGRGTSTYEGCGIAWSIAEHLAKETKCFALFATHFHEITSLENMVKTVKNCHMAAVADTENFTLLYQVRPGAMQKSFGIQVARLADFPNDVVERAQEVYNELEDEFAEKQSEQDKALLDKYEKAIEQLLPSNKNVEIKDDDIMQIIKQIEQDIEGTNSDYFKSVLSNANN